MIDDHLAFNLEYIYGREIMNKLYKRILHSKFVAAI
jgi:hypothetical protein